jgi:excisionase family DNA binding protein
MTQDSIFVGKREAALLLDISIRTIENLIRNHELPARRIGRRVVIPRQSLIEFSRRDHATQMRRR